MKLVHTLLFLLRPDKIAEDLALAKLCLGSLEKSRYKAVLVYNQGPMSKVDVENFLSQFHLEITVIGDAVNVGVAQGRQQCFQYIWDNMPDTEFISELHMDMIFTDNWEDALVDFLTSYDEPMVCPGIIDKNGNMPFSQLPARKLPESLQDYDSFLAELSCDQILHGFNQPCVHKVEVLKAVGGYDTGFLTGKQCFEDDSLLLGYYYYYGTRADWFPKINLRSFVYHAIALQRLDLHDNVMVNYYNLIKQYGAMGLKSLSHLHKSAWHQRFFYDRYSEYLQK